ncbi:hypothetical protein JCM6882_006152 [Rhodosporidiobolus microsporus]
MARPRLPALPSSPASHLTSRHAALAFLAAAAGVSAQSTSLPKIDFSAMGTVAVVGSFAGLSLYDASNPPVTYDSSASTLIGRTSDNDLRNLGATDQGGSIAAICQLDDGSVFLGGNFTAVGGVSAANVAQYDPAGKTFAALGSGLDGEVRALACNGTTVYAGGDFSAPSGVDAAGPNVAAWESSSASWTALPFYGFNGAVESIFQSDDGQSLFFGGAFSTTFSNSSANSTSSSSSSSSPNGSPSSQIPSLGSSLTPISLNTSDYWASPTTYTSGFGRPQYIFCPRREDGIGASWMLVDGQDGFFIARMYRELNVRGIRLGNMFYEGRGTKNFSVVALPNNEVLELTYNSDPSDPSSPLLTCQADCPLAHNSSLPYQDFLFPPGTTMTGFQLNVLGWYGASGGLHLLQLLSDGSYAYAVESQNTSPCAAGLGASTQASVETDGEWATGSVVTSIAGTTQDVLIATIAGGTSPDDAPSVTWTPYVQQDGNYAVYLVTPGCTAQGTCSRRTSVSVTANPKDGTANTTTINQIVSEDISTLIFNGTLSAGSDSITVRLSLAEDGAPTSGQRYEMVADYINLVAASTRGDSVRLERAYGLFEYPLGGSGSTGTFGDAVAFEGRTDGEGVNASAVLTNATGVEQMLSMRLGEGATVNAVVSTGQGDETQLFVGGNFTWSPPSSSSDDSTSTSANIISYRLSTPLPAPNGGLSGPVTALAVLDGALFAAGSFDATADGSVTGLGGIARWNYSSSSEAAAWEALGDLPDTFAQQGSIARLAVVASSADKDDAPDSLAAVGAGGSGLAFFSPASSSWNSTAGGFFLGNLTSISPPSSTSENQTTYLAGNVAAAMRNAAPGGAVIGAGKGGQPYLTSFGFGFNSSSSSSSSSSASSAVARVKRSTSTTEGGPSTSAASGTPPILLSPRGGMSRVVLEPRAPQSSSAVNLTLPSPIQAVAASSAEGASTGGDQVLAGAFWKNGSTELMILGGAFRTANASNLALYDAETGSLSALPGAGVGEGESAIEGAVTSLLVVDDEVWVGGNFTAGGDRQGLVVYGLKEEGVQGGLPGLGGYTGTNATVSAIAQRPGYDEQILVAGAFSQAGSLWCQSVCLWDTKDGQWSNLGPGLQGVVGGIDFAGSKSEYLLAAGNFVLESENRYVARWNFKNSTWSGLGAATDLPGPATAVSSDNDNKDKIFVAGASTAGSPYLYFWNGTSWSDVNNNTLATGSGVQSLAFVPLQSNHDANDIIEANRMLMVSGDLTINDTSVASALYDGESWYPYLLASSATGSAGIVSQLFFSTTDFSLSGRSHLSPGIVILVSIAIALGVVFLLVLVGLLVALARRRDEPQTQYPPAAAMHDGTGTETSSLHRPTSLLQTVGAATAVLLDPKGEKGVPSGGGAYAYGDEGAGLGSFDAAAAGAGAGAMSYGSEYGDDEDAQPSAALARYSFHGEHPGELSVSANENLQVLESSDPNWWLVANERGDRGLVPNSYLC